MYDGLNKCNILKFMFKISIYKNIIEVPLDFIFYGIKQ